MVLSNVTELIKFQSFQKSNFPFIFLLLPYLILSFFIWKNFSFKHLICAAIATVVTVAEILKNNGFAVEKSKKILLILNEQIMLYRDLKDSVT